LEEAVMRMGLVILSRVSGFTMSKEDFDECTKAAVEMADKMAGTSQSP
jgi:hypothetical protein